MGTDNDCDGSMDNIQQSAMLTADHCGSCSNNCTTTTQAQQPNIDATCGTLSSKMTGCIYQCDAGFIDTNNNLADGCECTITNGGVEICDGKYAVTDKLMMGLCQFNQLWSANVAGPQAVWLGLVNSCSPKASSKRNAMAKIITVTVLLMMELQQHQPVVSR
jgi:hypothetical protein